MSVHNWVMRAVEASSKAPKLRDIQRFIDETYHEELAVDTLQNALDTLVKQDKLTCDSEGCYHTVKSTSQEDAINRLFNS
jgi:hypothetical protein